MAFALPCLSWLLYKCRWLEHLCTGGNIPPPPALAILLPQKWYRLRKFRVKGNSGSATIGNASFTIGASVCHAFLSIAALSQGNSSCKKKLKSPALSSLELGYSPRLQAFSSCVTWYPFKQRCQEMYRGSYACFLVLNFNPFALLKAVLRL